MGVQLPVVNRGKVGSKAAGTSAGILLSTQERPNWLQVGLERATYYKRVVATQPTQGSPF